MATKTDTTRGRLTKLEDAVASLQQQSDRRESEVGALRTDVARNEARVDDLAAAIKKLMDGIDDKYADEVAPLRAALADLHERIKTLEQRELRFNAEARIVTLENRVAEANRKRSEGLKEHGQRIGTLSGTVGALEKRIHRLEGERDEA